MSTLKAGAILMLKGSMRFDEAVALARTLKGGGIVLGNSGYAGSGIVGGKENYVVLDNNLNIHEFSAEGFGLGISTNAVLRYFKLKPRGEMSFSDSFGLVYFGDDIRNLGGYTVRGTGAAIEGVYRNVPLTFDGLARAIFPGYDVFFDDQTPTGGYDFDRVTNSGVEISITFNRSTYQGISSYDGWLSRQNLNEGQFYWRDLASGSVRYVQAISLDSLGSSLSPTPGELALGLNSVYIETDRNGVPLDGARWYTTMGGEVKYLDSLSYEAEIGGLRNTFDNSSEIRLREDGTSYYAPKLSPLLADRIDRLKVKEDAAEQEALRERVDRKALADEQQCFAAGTMIRMADGSEKPIEQVRVGDAVASFASPGGPLTSANVTQTMQRAEQVVIWFHGTWVTPGHVWACPDGAYRRLIDVLEADGAVVWHDGRHIRARTRAEVGTLDDATVAVLVTPECEGVEAAEPFQVLMRANTIAGAGPDGLPVTIRQAMEALGLTLDPERHGFVDPARPDQRPQGYEWKYAGVPFDRRLIAEEYAEYRIGRIRIAEGRPVFAEDREFTGAIPEAAFAAH